MQIIMATGNKDKVKEIQAMLEGSGLEVVSMKEAGCFVDIEETGTTFEENAVIKAETIRNLTNRVVLADDSGLEIDYLGGAPGVYSARFMGEDTPYTVKCRAFLDKLEGVPDEKRGARFVCAMAIAYPAEMKKETKIFKGFFEGRIAHEAAGDNGFGFDPIFYVPERGCTSAELPPEEKNLISHRGKALKLAADELKKELREKNQ